MSGHNRRPLADIASALAVEIAPPASHLEISGISYDSRKVALGDLFCCIPGTLTDGHLFADPAVNAGAVALLVERSLGLGVPELVVADARRGSAVAAAAFYGRPADQLLMLGITGTNGKTTTTFLLESILEAEGQGAGLIGTIETDRKSVV
jgi:UDP-N-acetylmuramoyl-L-alanyl-D-glutamate--2,6-diaminopimelate ligase